MADNFQELVDFLSNFVSDRENNFKQLEDDTFFANQPGYLLNSKNLMRGINLSRLSINDSELSTIVDQIVSCPSKIKYLLLNENDISNASPIASIVDLEHIELSWNRLEVVDFLEGLKSLRVALLTNNNITQCHENILDKNIAIKLQNDFKEGVFLHGNPLNDPPAEVFIDNALPSKFRNRSKNEFTETREIRVIMIGSGGSGKTSLTNRILGKPIDSNEPSTKHVSIYKDQMEDTRLSIWDFAGQESMLSIHRFFLAERSLYIILLDCRREESATSLLDYVSSFARKAPIIVVLNKIDENSFHDLDRAKLRRKYKNIIHFCRLSCITQEGLKNFLEIFSNTIKTEKTASIVIPKTWNAARAKLQKSLENYMDRNVCKDICAQHGIDENDFESFMEFAHNIGFLFQNNIPTMELVCSPSWLVETVYPLLSRNELTIGGVIDNGNLLPTFELTKLRSNIEQIYKNTEEKPKWVDVRIALELMQSFELCVDRGFDSVFIPDLLKNDSQVFKDEAGKYEVRVCWDYDILPKYLMYKIHIRLQQYVEDNKQWKEGMIVSSSPFQSNGIVDMQPTISRISVSVRGGEYKSFLTIIRDEVNALNENLGFSEVVEQVELAENCLVDIRELQGLLAMGETHYVSGRLRERFEITKVLTSHGFKIDQYSREIEEHLDLLGTDKHLKE